MKTDSMKTDVAWEKWGKEDPYFGVLTHEKFRSRNLTQEGKIEFFESGRNHVNYILEVCRRYFDQDFSPKKVLDFGCGVGRLIVPFAEIAEHVVGLDVSKSMLKEALKNCNDYSLQNISLLESDDNLSSLDGCFDLIHSFIVFQHIPVERGRRIFANLLSHLKGGGICAIQITYSKTIFAESNGVPPIEQSITPVEPPFTLYNQIKRHFRNLVMPAKRLSRSPAHVESPYQDPEMQMNPYNVNKLLFQIQSLGIRQIHVEFTDQGGELGVFLFFQKPWNV